MCPALLTVPELAFSRSNQSTYVRTYGVLVVTLVVARLTEGVVFALLTARASRNLHDQCFARVMHGTMAYFDTTPLGRILNRFSGDLDQVMSVVRVVVPVPSQAGRSDLRMQRMR